MWNVLICTQRGYGFNKSHTLAYSIIGLQELNLCYKYSPIYWQTANLIVDSGAVDENAGDSTNYGKMAIAIAAVQKENVKVELPLINSADFGFKADVENNRIIFGLKGINGIGDDIVQAIIQNRPFNSMEDFARKMLDRGSKIVVAGIRRDDSFRPMIYKDTIYQHTVNKVQEIHLDGTLLLQSERTKVD